MARQLLLLLFVMAGPLWAAGTSAEGWAIIRLLKFGAKGGLFIPSYEGEADVAGYNEDQDCNEKEKQCYEPALETFELSIRDIPENKNLINFMLSNLDKEMIIHYRRHRFTPVSLSSDTEVLEAFPQLETVPVSVDRVFKVEKTGDKDSYDMFGRVLRLEKRGLALKTWEGLYLDRKQRKVHPFSLTNEGMAQHVLKIIRYLPEYHFGVMEHYLSMKHESTFDIFEINYNGPTGRL